MNQQINICKSRGEFRGRKNTHEVWSGINQTLTNGKLQHRYDGTVDGQESQFTSRAARRSRADSFEVGADKVDKILGQFGSNLLLGAVGEVEANMRFKHFAHEAVDAPADGGKEHQLAAAFLIGGERTLHGIELSAQLSQALKQLHFFPFVVRHGATLRLDNTHPGYSINPMGV